MHPLKKHSRIAHAVVATVSILFLALFFTQTSQIAFAGKTERAAKCVTKGDSKVSKSIAKKVVKHAIKKYEIADLVDEQTTKRAKKEVYAFLKWKLGNPSAICAQYVTAGQKHFNKAYRDEAAAALLGFDLPNEKAGRATFQLPPELVDFWIMTEKLQNTGKAIVLEKYYGIPASLTKQLLDAQTEFQGKVVKRIGFNIPKKYDFPNQMVLATIEAKRNPEQAKANFQKVVDEAAKQDQSQPQASSPGTKSPAVSDEDEDVTDEEDVPDLEDEQGQKSDKDKKVMKKKKKKKLPF